MSLNGRVKRLEETLNTNSPLTERQQAGAAGRAFLGSRDIHRLHKALIRRVLYLDGAPKGPRAMREAILERIETDARTAALWDRVIAAAHTALLGYLPDDLHAHAYLALLETIETSSQGKHYRGETGPYGDRQPRKVYLKRGQGYESVSVYIWDYDRPTRLSRLTPEEEAIYRDGEGYYGDDWTVPSPTSYFEDDDVEDNANEIACYE